MTNSKTDFTTILIMVVLEYSCVAAMIETAKLGNWAMFWIVVFQFAFINWFVGWLMIEGFNRYQRRRRRAKPKGTE
jgi:hypothetical protein